MKICGCIATFAFVFVVYSSAVCESDAGKEMPFSLGIDARANGLGGGYTALASDAGAIYHNPAALAQLDYQEFTFLHTQLFASTIYDAAAWVFPIAQDQGIGVGFMRIGTGSIKRYDNFLETGEFDYSQSQFIVSYGRSIFSTLALGGSIKVVRQSLDRFSDFGYGLDLSFSSRIATNFSFGAMARSIVGAEVKLDETPEKAPASLTVGAALHEVSIANAASLTITADVEKVERRNAKILAGAEILFNERYALRSGYFRNNLVFGAGVQLGRIQVDYAYKLLDVIGDSHFFSLSFKLGKSKLEKSAARDRRIQEQSTIEERRRRFSQNRERADQYFKQFNLDSSLIYYQRALAFDEQNQEVIGIIAAIEHSRRVQAEQEAKIIRDQAERTQLLRNYYDQAAQLYGRKFYRPALDLLSLIFEVQPQHVDALRLKEEIETAVEEDVVNSLRRGDSALSRGQTSAAIDAYNRALDLDSVNARALQGKRRALSGFDQSKMLNAAIDLFNEHKYDDAARMFGAVLEANPGDKLAVEYLDRIAAQSARPVAGPVSLEELQKNNVYWPMYLDGLRLMRNKQYQEAIDVWQKILEVYPNQENTLNNIKQARLRLQSNGNGKN